MLTREENEVLCRVGRGTPMGDMMRRYWIPALLSSELAEPDCAPRRVRLLGVDLVAFRDTKGTVGILDEFCPHRGASLVLARNEDCALTCVYHGWKVAADGTILETPAEPEDSDFGTRIRAVAYPVVERGGLIWTYLGPHGTAPQFPAWEWTSIPQEQVAIVKLPEECNWAQALEGVIDSAHTGYLHASDAGHHRQAVVRDRRPRLEADDTSYGFWYAAIRKPADDPDRSKYIRTTHFVAPFYGVIPGPPGWGHMQAFVPVDDEHTTFYYFQWRFDGPADLAPILAQAGAVPGVDLDSHGAKIRHRGNNWLQDREKMKQRSYCGISGVQNQDMAVQESMGAIYDRTREHLGTSDLAVIRFRRIMLEAARRFVAGEPPIGLSGEIPYAQFRGGEAVIPIDQPWQSVGPVPPPVPA
ncbi:MAG: Rieske 2Fe-2S domain-containing protein [Chloroflexota bacterium]